MSEPSKEALVIADKAQTSINTAAHVYGMTDIALAIDALCAERVAEVRSEAHSYKTNAEAWEREADIHVARIATLTAQRDSLNEALQVARLFVFEMAEWNKSVEQIIGKQPETGFKNAADALVLIDAALKEVEG